MIPLALYAVSAPVSGYFIWNGINGERGLKQREAYERKMARLVGTAAALAEEKTRFERRISRFRSQAVDRDLLEEQARSILGRVAANEVVVMMPAQR